jgi:hypothetical protein
MKMISRRKAIATTSAGIIGTMVGLSLNSLGLNINIRKKLALDGGEKSHQGPWPQWPV